MYSSAAKSIAPKNECASRLIAAACMAGWTARSIPDADAKSRVASTAKMPAARGWRGRGQIREGCEQWLAPATVNRHDAGSRSVVAANGPPMIRSFVPARYLPPVLTACAIGLGAFPPIAAAENHALIMWIGEYADPRANLPGIELDAKRAHDIAIAMGVPEKNIVVGKNRELTWKGMAAAINGLTQRIKPGDKVFVYYSGHGADSDNTGPGKKCSEGMVAQDIKLYFDRDLENDLSRLGAKASQVVMMNDSCFSGGAANTDQSKDLSIYVPKSLPATVKVAAGAKPASAADASARACGDAVNKNFLSKDLEVIQTKGARLLYIAASADNEVSYATAQGSVATQAWAACIADPATDTDHSGLVSGEELRACAQSRIDHGPLKQHQTITLRGTSTLAVSFVEPSAGGSAARAAPVDGAKVLEDIRAGSDASYAVKLAARSSTLHIAQDFYDLTVETNRAGYLYLIQIGTDGKRFTLLFPNKIDNDNHIAVGSLALPRTAWKLRSAGPAGTDHLLALISATPRDFSQGMNTTGTFASAATTNQGAKDLVVVATGANAGGNGRYGASEVVHVQEAP
jgi:hypothetical protein